MKTQPSNLRTAEQGQTIKVAYLYRFTYGAGGSFFFCSYDAPIIVNGGPGAKMTDPQTFAASGIQHDKPEQGTELHPKNVTISLPATDANLRKYFLTIPAVEIGVEIWRANSASIPGPLTYSNDLYMEFKGVGASVNFDDYVISLSCTSLLLQEDRMVPRYNYQNTCNHQLYRQGTGFCNINQALYTTSVTIAALNRTNRSVDISQTTITVDSPGRVITITAETFEGGILVDSLGNKVGITACQVLPAAAGTRLWLQWMPPTLASAQAISISPGCQRIVRVCTNLFNNLANFGGMPYIPKAGNPAVDGFQV